MGRRNPRVRSERVEAFGKTWYRYPDSKRRSDAVYFKLQGEYLHRRVWQHHHGEIPEGFHVHHRDEDTSNNEISNLELLAHGDHIRHHQAGRCSQNKREHLDRVRPLAAAWMREWAKTDEGQLALRERAEKMLAVREPATKSCEYCGTCYTLRLPNRRDRFCSNACKSGSRRKSAVDDQQRVCSECSAPFSINRYAKTLTCSRSCAARLRERRRRGL